MNEETAHDLFEGLIHQLKRINENLETINGTLEVLQKTLTPKGARQK